MPMMNRFDKLFICIQYTAFTHLVDSNISTSWHLEITISQTERNLLIIYCFSNIKKHPIHGNMVSGTPKHLHCNAE